MKLDKESVMLIMWRLKDHFKTKSVEISSAYWVRGH